MLAPAAAGSSSSVTVTASWAMVEVRSVCFTFCGIPIVALDARLETGVDLCLATAKGRSPDLAETGLKDITRTRQQRRQRAGPDDRAPCLCIDRRRTVPGGATQAIGLDGPRDSAASQRELLRGPEREASGRFFERGLTSLEASTRIDLGLCGEWRAPARLHANVDRGSRELRREHADAPWGMAKSFDAIYHVARARGIEVES